MICPDCFTAGNECASRCIRKTEKISAGRRFLRGLAIVVGGLMPIALVFGLLVLGVVAVRGCT
jgi:hypothetical protein